MSTPTKAQLTAMSGPELLKLYNTLSGAAAIARFSSKADGVKRVAALLAARARTARTVAPMGEKLNGRPRQDFTLKARAKGTSAVRATSLRGQVFAAIRDRGPIALSKLREEFGPGAKGCVQKLLEVDWIERS